MERNAKNKIEPSVTPDEESLCEESTSAPWYVTAKERKYYNLKSLDKKSFVFTRIKPKRDAVSQNVKSKARKRKDSSDEETDEGIQQNGVESDESDYEKPVKKRKYQRKKLSEVSDDSTGEEEEQNTRQSRRSARLRNQ